MKKLFIAVALIGITGFAFGQQQQATSNAKTTKCSKTCTKSCGKNCKKGCCTAPAKTSSATSTSTSKASTTK